MVSGQTDELTLSMQTEKRKSLRIWF